MRSLERRRHEEVLLYQVATYLASLDQLFDEQANILREQTHRAKQAELAVRLQQIRAATAVSSEAVAQESLRQARDRCMQEWTRSGTPVPAIGEDQILLGTPVIGWGPLVITPQASLEKPERSTAADEREAATQPLENGNLEDGELSVPL